MSGITGVGHVVLWVRDEAASADFYRDVLGMEAMRHTPEPGHAFLSFGRQHHDSALFRVPAGEDSRGSVGLAYIAFKL
jgi:catechol 2,3-dioxygenase-like lactoylglutathione lyase family enzyme